MAVVRGVVVPALAVAVLAVVVLLAGLPVAGPAQGQTQQAAPGSVVLGRAAVGAVGAVSHGSHYVRGGRPVHPTPREVVAADGRTVRETSFVPFGSIGSVVLTHPAAVVERIGLHQSNHEGARDVVVAETAASPVLLPSRGRLSGRHSAADIVVEPDREIRSPVTGTVLRAGTYVLYCQHSDDFVVIAPDDAPHLEVKVLHIDGVAVAAGDRVVAGMTVIAPRATVLPFRSQVDATTARPSWPHTHIEVIDPAIPDVPNGGSGSSC